MEYGSAVYVADETYYFNACDGAWGYIKNKSTPAAISDAECFIQVFSQARDSPEGSRIANFLNSQA